jgi:hypothetical protein
MFVTMGLSIQNQLLHFQKASSSAGQGLGLLDRRGGEEVRWVGVRGEVGGKGENRRQ